jgi:hypothetical protein
MTAYFVILDWQHPLDVRPERSPLPVISVNLGLGVGAVR